MANVKKVDRRKPLERYYCVVCAETIDPKRIMQGSNTCCNEHGEILRAERRRLRNLTRCQLCSRPWTAEERAELAEFRRSKGIKPGPKPKPKPDTSLTPIEADLGTLQVQ